MAERSKSRRRVEHHLAGAQRVGADPGMLARESAYRARRAVRRGIARRGYRRLIAERPGRARLLPLRLGIPDHGRLPVELAGAADLVRSEAESALRHEVGVLGWGPLELGEQIDWQTDPLSGQSWPRLPYGEVDLERDRRGSDVKVVWELNRCHHFLALARAERIFGERRYGEELARQWAGWLDQNPAGTGVNWAMPMEVAVRAVNWVWALSTLGDRSCLGPALEERIIRSLRAHIAHIRWEIEGSPSLRGNHYLANITAIAVGSVALADRLGPRFPSQALAREATGQLLADGFSFEAATGYHHLATELLLISAWLGEGSARPLGTHARERIRAAATASLLLRGPGGHVAAFGDSDDGRILPLSCARARSHDPALWLAAATLGTPRPPPAHGSSAAAAGEVAFSFGLSAWERAMKAPQARPPHSGALPDAGIYVLAGGPSHLVVRCGDCGQNGRGGHAHNDALGFELTLAGVPIIVDPGTFTYTGDLDLRHHFRSTGAHSTIQVGEEEINPIDPGRPFVMRERAHPGAGRFDPGPPARLRAGHDGFAGIRAEREIEVAADGVVTITDALLPRGRLLTSAPGPATARLQLSPEADAVPVATGRLRVECRGVGAEIALTEPPDTASPAGTDASDAGGRAGPGGAPVPFRIAEAQVSRIYGELEPAPLIEVELGSSRGLQTVITPLPEAAS